MGLTFAKQTSSLSEKFEVDGVNIQASKEINELEVYCPNRSAGCDWIGKLKQVKAHRENNSGCPFEMLMCPHDCSLQLQRQYLASHIESQCPCYCRYCQTAADESVISNQHKENCNKFPLSCPNRCGESTIPRDQMTKHREKCPLELVICSFNDVGCTVKMARKDRESHNTKNTEKHLELARVHMCKMKTDFAEAMAASEQRYEKLNQTLDEAIKILHTKVTMNEVKTEQVTGNNRLMLSVEQKSIEAKKEAKANLSTEVRTITGKVQKIQTEVGNCKWDIQQNTKKLTTTENNFSKKPDTVNHTVQDLIKQRKSIFTLKNFVSLLVVILIAITVTKILAN